MTSTLGPAMLLKTVMLDNAHTLLDWLSRHTGYPAHRLPERAELLLCFSVAAAQEESAAAAASGGPAGSRTETAAMVAQKQHALRRARVHFKCDNSAKV